MHWGLPPAWVKGKHENQEERLVPGQSLPAPGTRLNDPKWVNLLRVAVFVTRVATIAEWQTVGRAREVLGCGTGP